MKLFFTQTRLAAFRRSPSWGAWIEINAAAYPVQTTFVAPPRGERGLKYTILYACKPRRAGRSPSWGAWIEMELNGDRAVITYVAPPRGERGLK